MIKVTVVGANEVCAGDAPVGLEAEVEGAMDGPVTGAAVPHAARTVHAAVPTIHERESRRGRRSGEIMLRVLPSAGITQIRFKGRWRSATLSARRSPELPWYQVVSAHYAMAARPRTSGLVCGLARRPLGTGLDDERVLINVGQVSQLGDRVADHNRHLVPRHGARVEGQTR